MKHVAALAALVLLAGCSTAPVRVVTVTMSPSAVASATSTVAAGGWNNARAFSEAALAGNYSEARKFVSPQSAAARYLQHQTAMDGAMTAAGDGRMITADDVSFDDGAEAVTFSYAASPTTRWQDFEYDASGLVTGWYTDESDDTLADRLWSKPAKATTSRASVQLVSAYRNDSALFVVLKVTAKNRRIMPDCSPLLSDVTHNQREATDCSAPASVPSQKSGYIAYTFDGATSGGTLRYLIEDTNWNELNAVKLIIRLGAEDPVH